MITVLPSPLACVGFAKTSERATGERVRQLVVWPARARESWQQKRQSGSHLPTCTPGAPVDDRETDPASDRPFISYTRTVDGTSIVTETRMLRWMFGRKQAGNSDDGDDDDDGYGSAVEGTEYQLGGQLAVGYVTDTTDLEDSDEDEDDEEDDGAASAGTPATSVRDPSASCAADHDVACGLHTPPVDDDTKRDRHLSLPTSPRDSPGVQGCVSISWRNNASARHSTVSLKSTVGSDKRRSWDTKSRGQSSKGDADGDADDEHEDQYGRSGKPGRKRCLQLDLRGLRDDDDSPMSEQTTPLAEYITSPTTPDSDTRGGGPSGQGKGNDTPPEVYHLDKSGLVTRFSELLDSSSIRMLYSSTFHTANILVEARDVHLARRLLQGRGRSPSAERVGYF